MIGNATHLIPYQVAHLDHLFGILYGMAFGGAFLFAPRGAPVRMAVIALPIVLFASLFYSPWQIEWRLVKTPPKLVSANADCRLRSPTLDVYVPTRITFVNALTKPVAVYWLDYQGNPQFILWLPPGASGDDNAFVAHPFCVVDVENGVAIQAIVVMEPEQIFTIR